MQYVAFFFGGAFFVNGLPHFINGIMGRAFQTPFAHPPGKGRSLAMTNVIWGFINLMAAYFLIFHVGEFTLHDYASALSAAGGGLISALSLAHWFSKFNEAIPENLESLSNGRSRIRGIG